MVVEDVGDRRRQVAVVLGVGLLVALPEEVELELGAEHGREPQLGRALDLPPEDLAREGATGRPSCQATSQRTSAVASSHGIRRSVATSGLSAKSP